MSTRQNIYYWKCDSPQSLQDKRDLYFEKKYARTDVEAVVRSACSEFLGRSPDAIAPIGGDGNHFAYIITNGSKTLFFRADDGAVDDDYLLAESSIMNLAKQNGLPVPMVFHTDISQDKYPIRFQIMEHVPAKSLSYYHQQGKLEVNAVGRQLGEWLHRLHDIELEGYGFIDTDLLLRSGRLHGLESTYPDYFHCRLDDHIGYLVDHEIITRNCAKQILRIFELHQPLLSRTFGVLTHRDAALWNVLGTSDRITAIIDWDDAVSGDPADDFGILHCFYDETFMNSVTQGYWAGEPIPEDFLCRVWLHMLRNMLWKTKLRHSLGYFDRSIDFFLAPPDRTQSLRDYTLQKLQHALDKLTL